MLSFLGSARLQKSLLLLCASHFMLDFFTGIWPIYKTIARIDLVEAGIVAGASGFLAESLQMGFGFFCDKGYRKAILILGLLLGSCVLLVPYAHSLTACFWVLFLLMLGSSSFHPAGAGYAGGLTDAHKGKTILFFSAGGMLGLALSQMVFTRIFHVCNGHALLLFLPVIAIICLLLYHPFPSLQKAPFSKESLMLAFAKAKKPLLLLYFIQLTNYTLVLSFLFLLPDILLHKMAGNWLAMGGGHFFFIIGAACALPPAGMICDRLGQRKVLITAISLAILFLYTFLQLPLLPGAMGATLLFCLGGCLNSINPIVVSWGHKIVPESPSTVSALLMGFAWCFANLGPLAAGCLSRCFQGPAILITLYWLGLLLVCSLVLTLMMPATETALESQDG